MVCLEASPGVLWSLSKGGAGAAGASSVFSSHSTALVGGLWKICASQIGSFPQVDLKIKSTWNLVQGWKPKPQLLNELIMSSWWIFCSKEGKLPQKIMVNDLAKNEQLLVQGRPQNHL